MPRTDILTAIYKISRTESRGVTENAVLLGSVPMEQDDVQRYHKEVLSFILSKEITTAADPRCKHDREREHRRTGREPCKDDFRLQMTLGQFLPLPIDNLPNINIDEKLHFYW